MNKSLKLFNSLSKEKEVFYTNKKGKVSMYVCGPTVYNLLHIGNFRGPIFFNLVRNWLEHLKYKVKYVYNYTDIDDKIIDKAKIEKLDAKIISQKYIVEFEKDYASLKIPKPSFTPKCTDFIDDIIIFISELIDNHFAYYNNGHVFFSIKKFDNYGKLSRKNVDDLLVGHRVKINDNKKNPLDFVLWKPSNGDDPGWESPWGYGRPGWHIECSAMSSKLLGSNIDIHGGGIDLLFPHHENEIAQSESRFKTSFSNFWVHHHLINFDNQKMSKSLGNIIKARDFITDYNSEILKILILSVHYRSVLNFNESQINNSITNLIKIYSSINLADLIIIKQKNQKKDLDFKNFVHACEEKIYEFMNNDFNTPGFFSIIFDLIRRFNLLAVNKKITPELKYISLSFLSFIKKYGKILGLFNENSSVFLSELNLLLLKNKNISITHLEELINKRNKARKEKNYKLSDEIRNEIFELGIEIKDEPDGLTKWSVRVDFKKI